MIGTRFRDYQTTRNTLRCLTTVRTIDMLHDYRDFGRRVTIINRFSPQTRVIRANPYSLKALA